MDNAYVRSALEVLKHFNVQEETGLSNALVTESRQKHGRNGMSSLKRVCADEVTADFLASSP